QGSRTAWSCPCRRCTRGSSRRPRHRPRPRPRSRNDRDTAGPAHADKPRLTVKRRRQPDQLHGVYTPVPDSIFTIFVRSRRAAAPWAAWPDQRSGGTRPPGRALLTRKVFSMSDDFTGAVHLFGGAVFSG